MSKRLKGVTLVEVLVYLALFGSFMLTISLFFTNISISNRDTLSRLQLQNNIIFITNHFSQFITKEYELDEAQSTLADNSSHVHLYNPTNSDINIYKMQNGELLEGDLSTETSLNYQGIKVDQFFVEKIIDSNNVIQGIRITITLTDIDNTRLTETFETSYTL